MKGSVNSCDNRNAVDVPCENVQVASECDTSADVHNASQQPSSSAELSEASGLAKPKVETWVPTTIWNRPFIFCCIAGVFQYLGLQMSHGILAKYTESLGGDAVAVGIVTGLFAITAMGFKIISGPAIDAFDHKKILMIFMIVLGCAFLGCSVSSTVVGVGASMLLRGFAQAFAGTVSLVMVAVYLPKDQLGKGIAYYSVAQAVCQAIGPSISLTLSVYIGYKATYAIAGALEIIGALTVLFINKPSHGTKKFRISMESVFHKNALIPMIVIVLINIPYSAVTAFLVLDAVNKGIPQEQIGLFFTVFAITTVVLRPVFGNLADKIGVKKAMIPITALYAISFVAMPFVNTLTGYLALAVVNACGMGVSLPIMQALAMKLVPEDQYTAASNSCFIGNDIGCFAGPVISGWLVNIWGYSAMWISMALPCVAAIALLAFVKLPKDV